jgi:hypothetical protein
MFIWGFCNVSKKDSIPWSYTYYQGFLLNRLMKFYVDIWNFWKLWKAR